MSIPFLSKLMRINAAHHFFGLKASIGANHASVRAPTGPLTSLWNKSVEVEKQCPLRPLYGTCFCCHFPPLRHYSSSTSSSGSDGGEKGEGPNQKIPIPLTAEESQGSNSTDCRPSPACAALHQDFKTRPLDEHEIGLDLSRRGRSKPPLVDPTTPNQSQHRKGRKPRQKDKQQGNSEPAPRPPNSRASSRKRAKDRLETLSRQDCDRRVFFSYKLLLIIEDEPEILDNILWTDECNFNLPKLGSLIKKPPIAESELLPQIAWCGISTQGTVGPYFFNSHVTDKSYLKMLENYLLPELEDKGYNLKELWFQQDGAPWHRSKLVLDFLTSVFDYRIISLGTKFIWPPRSQDLTPMDYFFWDYMKVKLDFKHSKYDLCFQKSFREILTREVNTASINALQGAIYQLPERLEMCVTENGARFVHLLYPDRYEKDGTRKARKQSDDLLNKSLSKKATSQESPITHCPNVLEKARENIASGQPSAPPSLPATNNVDINSTNNNNNTNVTPP